MLRVVLSSIKGFRRYGIQFEKDSKDERCYVVYWDDNDVKNICVGCESLDQAVPLPEPVPLPRIVGSLSTSQLHLAIIGASPSLIRVLEDNRADGCRFVVYQGFDDETLLLCLLQVDQDVFGMVSATLLVEYLVHRLKSASYEGLNLCNCIRQGSVRFADYRSFLAEVVDLWPSLRPYVRCTGHTDAKGKANSVSRFLLFFVSDLSSFSFFFYLPFVYSN